MAYKENSSIEEYECEDYKVKDQHYLYLYSDSQTVKKTSLKAIINLQEFNTIEFEYEEC